MHGLWILIERGEERVYERDRKIEGKRERVREVSIVLTLNLLL